VLALAGLMMATPVVVRVVFARVPPLIASAAMIGLAPCSWPRPPGNISVWIKSDELMRRATAEISAVTFAILQGALFLWAAGEKLGLLPVLTLWDAATVMMTAYLIIAGVVTWRRGLAG
jgi:peptidoglycan/LPS O-acetylase OafA/YrhL